MGDKFKKGDSLFIGKSNDLRFNYPIENLKKHFIALGSSGSGKTVLSKVLIEECASLGIPAIVVDPQGDLASLGLIGNPEILNEKDLSSDDYQPFFDNTAVAIFTPISTKGIPLCLNPLQVESKNIDEEELVPIMHTIATSVTRLLGYNLVSDKGKSAEAVIYGVLKYFYDDDKIIKTFDELSDILQKKESRIKTIIEEFITDNKELAVLIKKLNYMGVGEKKLLFQYGAPVDIEMLLGKKRKDGKTQISIIYLNSLANQADKDFFLSILTTQLYQWMLDHPSDALQCVFMIDEIAPYIPAGAKKPIPKPILKLLFKQARKYGVGCIIATQNPGDIDYKAFAQFGTWAIGRLSVKQDQKKVESALKSLSSVDLSSVLPKLKPGNFVVFAPDINKNLIDLNVRWLYSDHKTLTEEDVKKIMDPKRSEFDKFIIDNTGKVKIVPDLSVDDGSDYDDNSVYGDNSEIMRSKKPMTMKKNKLKKFSDEKTLFFNSITKNEALEIANTQRKRAFLIGPKEEIIEFSTHLIPYYQAVVRTKESKYLGMKNELIEYEVYFNAINGNVLKIKNDEYVEIPLFGELHNLKDPLINLLSTINKSNKELSSIELSEKTGVGHASVLKMLSFLQSKKLVLFDKASKFFNNISLSYVNINGVLKISSEGCKIHSNPIEGEFYEPQIKIKNINIILQKWFDSAEIISYKIVHLPEHHVKFSQKNQNKMRVLKLNGVNGSVIEGV